MSEHKTAPRSVPVAEWPVVERELWQAACVAPRLLRAGGAASHMKPATQAWQARCYGYLLDYCQRQEVFDPEACATGHVTPLVLAGFVRELEERVSSVTRALYLKKAARVAHILSPEKDFGWLREIVLELKNAARPRSKQGRIVTSDQLHALGMSLMARAEAATDGTLMQRAIRFREGLMVALLALCPIRLGNFARLELGKHVRLEEGEWWIHLGENETKSGRPDERPVPDKLWPVLDRWVWHWRDVFHPTDNAFWPSIKGGGLAYTYVGSEIARITEDGLGHPVNAHLFRDCSVLTVALHAGGEMGVASGLLQHSDPRTTDKYYNKGASIEASRRYRDILAEF